MSHYIIGLKPDANAALKAKLQSFALSLHSELDLGSRGSAIVGEFDSETIEEIKQHNGVKYIEQDGHVETLGIDIPSSVSSDAESLPWGVERIGAENITAAGDGVDVAIVDTGIDSDHEDLQNVGEGIAIVECEGDCSEPWDDDHSHGTHVAGTVGAVDNQIGVPGVATGATLHAVKVLKGSGGGSFSKVAEGVMEVVNRDWDVINMSLGASQGSQAIKDAVGEAVDNGITVVAAAGNSGPCKDCVGYPAAYEECIAVSATDSLNRMAEFSSQGPQVDVAAPGKNIRSTLPDNRYGNLSGTSMAAPHVAGAIAVLAGVGLPHPARRKRLTNNTIDIGLPAEKQGNGLINIHNAMPTENPTAEIQLTMTRAEPPEGNIKVGLLGSDSSIVSGASVSIDGPTTETGQSSGGFVTFEGVPIGDYTITASHDKYEDAQTSIDKSDFE